MKVEAVADRVPSTVACVCSGSRTSLFLKYHFYEGVDGFIRFFYLGGESVFFLSVLLS